MPLWELPSGLEKPEGGAEWAGRPPEMLTCPRHRVRGASADLGGICTGRSQKGSQEPQPHGASAGCGWTPGLYVFKY